MESERYARALHKAILHGGLKPTDLQGIVTEHHQRPFVCTYVSVGRGTRIPSRRLLRHAQQQQHSNITNRTGRSILVWPFPWKKVIHRLSVASQSRDLLADQHSTSVLS